jgi:hypothetical protein
MTWICSLIRRAKRGLKVALYNATARPALGYDLWVRLRDIGYDHNGKRYGRPPGLASGYLPLRKSDVDSWFGELEIFIQDLAADKIKTATRRGTFEDCIRVTPNLTSSIDLKGFGVRPHSLKIENISTVKASGLGLKINGRDWSSIEGLMEDVLGKTAGKDEEEKAFAVYTFCKENSAHGPAPSESRDDVVVIDPVSFFNFMGYGLCGFRANVFAVLCEKAGLRSRVWNVSGHTFPEVYYNGAWRLLDPDAEVFYPDTANSGELMSLAMVERDPASIIGPVRMLPLYESRKALVISWYEESGTNTIVADGADLLNKAESEGLTEIAMDILPGESVTFFYDKKGPWLSAPRVFPVHSPPKSRTIVVNRIDLMACGAMQYVKSKGVAEVRGSDGATFLKADKDGGRMELPGRSTYPVLDCIIKIKTMEECLDKVELLYNRGSGAPCSAEAVHVGPGIVLYRLRRVFYGTTHRDRVSLTLKFNGPATIRELKVIYVCQANRSALPRFSGGSNRIEVHGEQSCANGLELTLCYDSDCAEEFDRVCLISPADGQEITPGGLARFEWKPSVTGRKRYQFMLSQSEGSTRAVAPNFDRLTDCPELELSDDDRCFLVPGREYFWKVRGVDEDGRGITSWSEQFKVVITL